MRKPWLVPFLTLFLLLSGCGRSVVITPSPAPPTQTPAPTPVTAALASEPGCTVISPIPTPGPTQRSLFPPVTGQDWVHGPETADITILEYSDFQ